MENALVNCRVTKYLLQHHLRKMFFGLEFRISCFGKKKELFDLFGVKIKFKLHYHSHGIRYKPKPLRPGFATIASEASYSKASYSKANLAKVVFFINLGLTKLTLASGRRRCNVHMCRPVYQWLKTPNVKIVFISVIGKITLFY